MELANSESRTTNIALPHSEVPTANAVFVRLWYSCYFDFALANGMVVASLWIQLRFNRQCLLGEPDQGQKEH